MLSMLYSFAELALSIGQVVTPRGRGLSLSLFSSSVSFSLFVMILPKGHFFRTEWRAEGQLCFALNFF